jgi:hypothetical protein
MRDCWINLKNYELVIHLPSEFVRGGQLFWLEHSFVGSSLFVEFVALEPPSLQK